MYTSQLPGEIEPIRTVEEYTRLRAEYLQIRNRRLALSLEAVDAYADLYQREEKLWARLRQRMPYVLVSRCPFCNAPIRQIFGVFSLQDEYWYLESGSGRDEVWRPQQCPHLFCIDGALNLNGHVPTEATGSTNPQIYIYMAAEVPFIKPRVLNLPTMRAVVHALPVADRYTAYPIVYFAETQPPQQEFCIPWARTQFYTPIPGFDDALIIGSRNDAQKYNLWRWIEQGKLLWLSEDGSRVEGGQPEAFPYRKLNGRRHPYVIEDGQIHDLPNPAQGEPEIKLETFF